MKQEVPYKKLLLTSIPWFFAAILAICIFALLALLLNGAERSSVRTAGIVVSILLCASFLWQSFSKAKRLYGIKVKCCELVFSAPSIAVDDLVLKIEPAAAQNENRFKSVRSDVAEALKKMMKQGFFPGASFDKAAGRVIFPGESAARPESAPSGDGFAYCGMCGTKVRAGNRFCTHCGAELTAPASPDKPRIT